MFIVYGCVMSSILFSVHCHCLSTDIKAIDSVGDPPLPIPNREVKPDSADGTANVCGRVGHRHFYKNPGTLKSPWIFLYSVANRFPFILQQLLTLVCCLVFFLQSFSLYFFIA